MTVEHTCPRCSYPHEGEYYLCEGCRRDTLPTSQNDNVGMTPEEHDTFCAISDALWGGELGWVDNLPKFRREVLSRIRDGAFWRHLHDKTLSLDKMKAQFMEDMLNQAAVHLQAMLNHEIEAPGCETCVSARKFLELYKDTWLIEEMGQKELL